MTLRAPGAAPQCAGREGALPCRAARRFDAPRSGATFAPSRARGPAVALENVTFWYQMRPNNIVLRGMNVVIPGGSTAALVGKSGGGKTTVVSLLLRYYDVKGGAITLDGRDIRSLNLASVHRHVGLVMQDTQMFNRTIAGNIGYGVAEEDATEEAIEAAARKVRSVHKSPYDPVCVVNAVS